MARFKKLKVVFRDKGGEMWCAESSPKSMELYLSFRPFFGRACSFLDIN